MRWTTLALMGVLAMGVAGCEGDNVSMTGVYRPSKDDDPWKGGHDKDKGCSVLSAGCVEK